MKSKELFLNYPSSSNQISSSNENEKVASYRLLEQRPNLRRDTDIQYQFVSIDTDTHYQLEHSVKGSLDPEVK